MSRLAPPHVVLARRVLHAVLSRDVLRALSVEPLSGFVDVPIVRLCYVDGEYREVTFAEHEATTIAIWLVGVLTGEAAADHLPVPEHWQRPWTASYRWTAHAWAFVQVALEARAGEGAR